jgi:cupin superfamily acireductone dioxygenase involved in methionine salvage
MNNAMKFLLEKEKQIGVSFEYWAQIEVVNMMKEYAESVRQLSAVMNKLTDEERFEHAKR